jgi:hypothetical protein
MKDESGKMEIKNENDCILCDDQKRKSMVSLNHSIWAFDNYWSDCSEVL